MGRKNTITIDDKKLSDLFDKALKAEPKLAAQALQDCVLDLAAESALRAPIESGDLRNNCRGQVDGQTIFRGQEATGAAVSGNRTIIDGTVGYSLPYALKQHEDLTLRHDRTDGYVIKTGKNAGKTVNLVAGGEAKFLERPFRERSGRYTERFEKAVEESLK